MFDCPAGDSFRDFCNFAFESAELLDVYHVLHVAACAAYDCGRKLQVRGLGRFGERADGNYCDALQVAYSPAYPCVFL